MRKKPGPKRRQPRAPSVDGPRIDAALLDWLDANAGKRMLELPLHFTGAQELGRALLCGDDVELSLVIDSTALSMTLRDHLAPHIETFPCTVWVRGTWGSLLPRPELVPALGPSFTVRSVIGRAPQGVRRIRWLP